jgi:DNA-binding response OmpR family regulator
MKVLLIEDEIDLAGILKKSLEESGFLVEMVHNGRDGLFYATNYSYDATILDITLPEIDGFTILESVRKKNIDLPVIMLTARGEVENRVKGLNTGADDYIAKPFDLVELLARLNAVIRRSKGKSSPEIEISDLIVNTNKKTVHRAGKEIKLSVREYNLLEYLVLNSNKVISRSEINEHIYEFDFDNESNVIDVYIMYLRNKIDKDYDKPLIHTVRGIGYIIEER